MVTWDKIEMDFIVRRGWRVNDEGLLVLTTAQAKGANIGRSIRNPEQRTLMIPSLHGCTLIFEGQHFTITK